MSKMEILKKYGGARSRHGRTERFTRKNVKTYLHLKWA